MNGHESREHDLPLLRLRAKLWLKVAVVCVALPCFLGIAIFSLWMLTRELWLGTLGILNIYLGLGLAVLAIMALTAYVVLARRSTLVSGKRVFWTTAAVLGLLGGNVILAGSMVWTAIEVETRYIVTIENQSESSFEEIEVVAQGLRVSFSAIPAGGEARAVLHFGSDSDLRLRGRLEGMEQDLVLEGYVCNGMGGEAHVVVLPDKSIQISHE